MTPSEYKARYENLPVPLADGSTTTIHLNQYRLKSRNYNAKAAQAFFDALKKRGVDMKLRADTGPQTIRITYRIPHGINIFEETVSGVVDVDSKAQKQVHDMARYVFAGKGAPEHCQIVLQLVDHWNLAPSGLQKYADDALGLDCNGFVGNYLWHAKHSHDWSSLGVANLNLGPDAIISGYFDGKRPLSRWDDIDPARSYIMGEVDKGGNIIPGGTAFNEGHIVITEPNYFRKATKSAQSAVWAVEATGGHVPGLWESWYSFRSVDKRKVFTIFREEMMAGVKVLEFKIAEAT